MNTKNLMNTKESKEKVNNIYNSLDNFEKNILFEKLLLEYTNDDYSSLNDDKEDKASNCVVCAFKYMKCVFWNCLMMGGSYKHNENDKQRISDILDELTNIFNKYKK